MSNIVAFSRPETPARGQVFARLLSAVTEERHAADDVFWLKEVAELLGFLASTGQDVPDHALAALAPFHDTLEERLRFYPQYYRFLLSICLDLEDLGMGGSKGAALCAWVVEQGLIAAELSDLQRAESYRLLSRRDAHAGPQAGDLAGRLHRFIGHCATFALPNKKVGYELTHIVFYLSEYGRRDPALSAQALQSLTYVGLLAYLDQDLDLLAEVCIAQRHAGQTPPETWETAVAQAHRGMRFVTDPAASLHDGFHAYLVTGWAMVQAGEAGFGAALPDGPLRIGYDRPQGVLRGMSAELFAMGAGRTADWSQARGATLAGLGPQEHEILYHAEKSVDCFADFYRIFARSGQITARKPDPARAVRVSDGI